MIAIATSPLTNDIYFAGNAIYKLGSVDPSTEEQTVFPVTFRFTTPDNKISNVEFFSNRDNMTMIEFDLKHVQLKIGHKIKQKLKSEIIHYKLRYLKAS